MDPKDFCRWLQGVFDISKLEELNEDQIAMIRVHLNTVFEDKTGGGTAGLPKKYRATIPFPSPSILDDIKVTCSVDAEKEELSWCVMTDGSDKKEEKKVDPYHKENAWKIDPTIKTVMSC